MHTDPQDEQHDDDLVITSVRITRRTRELLERHAPRHRNGRSAIIRDALDAHLQRLERETAA